MHDLIIGTLQECRVDGAKWLVPFRRHASRESYRMLFGDTHIIGAVWIGFFENIDSGTAWHGRGDPNHAVIALSLFNQRLPKYLGERGQV